RGAGLARHAVGARSDDQLVQRLEPPPGLDQLGGEVGEQLGMRGWGAKLAKVAGRTNDPPTEVVLPNPLGHGPRSEVVLWRGDPLGQCPATPCSTSIGTRRRRLDS